MITSPVTHRRVPYAICTECVHLSSCLPVITEYLAEGLCWMVAKRPSNMLNRQKVGSANTIVRDGTLTHT